MKAADELMNDATSKLHDAISATAVNKQTVTVKTGQAFLSQVD